MKDEAMIKRVNERLKEHFDIKDLATDITSS